MHREGSTFLIAWGMMMYQLACIFDIPIQRAASICPLLTACIPALVCSAIYTELFTVRDTTAAQNWGREVAIP